ncbi:MAG: uracil permease [Firmicutes bacterium]|nr:uracil permease [Bacillota bacterium]
MKRMVDVREKLPLLQTIPLSLQHLMALFGATVLVPLLFGIDPSICLFMNGIGTIIYSIVTRGGIPAFLGSSFAFIAPTVIIINKYGFPHAQWGFILFGVFFMIVSFIIKKAGTKWLDIIFPPPVMGAVVAVIGLELAPVACGMAGLMPGKYNPAFIETAMVTLVTGILASVTFRGFGKIIPVLIAVIVGYVYAAFHGQVDFTMVQAAPLFKIPAFTAPVFDLNAILLIVPAWFVVLAEHIGHLVVTGKVVEKDLMKDPGLHLSLLGDGISNFLSGFTGSPPNTTYGENIGVMAITKVYSVWVIQVAAVLSIIISLCGKLTALIRTIPTPVIGGICILLFGVIAVAGIRMLIEEKVDYSKNYNMILSSVVFITGVSGASTILGAIELKGMALAAVVGMSLSLLLYILQKLGLMNEKLETRNGEELS